MTARHASPPSRYGRIVRWCTAALLALVACVALATAAVAATVALQRARLPYTTQGRHFDGLMTVDDGAALAYAVVAAAAIALCCAAAWLARRMLRREAAYRPR